VWTGEDVRALPRIPSNARGVHQLHLTPLPPLAEREVSMAGYPLAVVVATTRHLARDAVGLIEVDYEPLRLPPPRRLSRPKRRCSSQNSAPTSPIA
jgi:CO/xanthine dehydrogenase Mo-binding subunit